MRDLMSYRVTGCVPITWWDTIIFTYYSPAYFTHFFILTATLVLILCGGVLPSGCAVLCYMLEVQLVFSAAAHMSQGIDSVSIEKAVCLPW